MALQENRWINFILPLQNSQEIMEYVTLWEQVSMVQLQEDIEDSIRWRWTPDGEYTTRSAYLIQFEGSYSKLKLTPIWKAQAEPKCHFFPWTLLHKKILTANNLMKRNWPNDPTCKLCGNNPETPTHLCKDCPYTKQAWKQLKNWLHLSGLNSILMTGSLHSYWRKCRTKFSKQHRKRIDGIMIYFWWNIWKERVYKQPK
jgi:hypothetical protein